MASSKPKLLEVGLLGVTLAALVVPLGLLLGIALMLYQGWAASVVWNLLAPHFFGLAEITYLQATAAMLILGFATMKSAKTDSVIDWLKFAIQPLLLIALAYIITKV